MFVILSDEMDGVPAAVADQASVGYRCIQARFQGGTCQDFDLLEYDTTAIFLTIILDCPKGKATMAVVKEFGGTMKSLAEYADCSAYQLRMGMHTVLEQHKLSYNAISVAVLGELRCDICPCCTIVCQQ